MNQYRHNTITLLEARRLRKSQAAYLAFSDRRREIDGLPRVQWRGRTLFTIRCEGPFGKGPHPVNVPEALLWQLISVQHFLCPFHQ